MVRKKRATSASAPPPRTRKTSRSANLTQREPGGRISSLPEKEDHKDDSDDLNNLGKSSLQNHKSFGKYRCLSGKNQNKNAQPMLNNVEVKVVDPCASSESENSNSLEASYLVNRFAGDVTFRSFSRIGRGDRSSDSGSPVTLKMPKVDPVAPDLSNQTPDSQITLPELSYDTQIPDPTLNIISCDDPRRSYKSPSETFNNTLGGLSPLLKIDKPEPSSPYKPTTGDDSQESVELMNTDENEVYTIYEIIGEDPDYQEPERKPEPDTEFEEKLNNMSISQDNDPDCQQSTEEKKLDELMSMIESCSTPNSMISEEESHPPVKSECELSNLEKSEVYNTDSSSSSSTGVRRSDRIKTINVMKQRSKGHGLVKAVQKKLLQPKDSKKFDPKSDNQSATQHSPVFSIPSSDSDSKPVKVKSRWRRSSEMEMESRSPITPPLNSPNSKLITVAEVDRAGTKKLDSHDPDIQERLDQFQNILVNEYHCEKTISKEAKKMTCDCFLTKEEIERGEMGCGDDCLNRLLMIECNSRCPVGDRCTNRRFQNNQYSELHVIKTEKKGLGIKATYNIPSGEFLMEYVGEVLNWQQFNQRAQEYSTDKNMHHYFMSLKGDAIIDATLKGNISRFINHSCDPNAETQKWTVNGDLRIGFFSKREIKSGEEITFDYQFQRYGKEGLRCFCEASNCRGWIGEEPDESEEEDEVEQEAEPQSEKTTDKVELDSKENIPKNDIKIESVQPEETANEPCKKAERKSRRRQFAKRDFNEILQDLDLEEEMKNLNRTGIKNQTHTLALCRTMVRAKNTSEQVAILKLLSKADLPCRRLFLDYRVLKFLAPWCDNIDGNFRLDMLIALEKLPILNKTVLKENNIFAIVEKWYNESLPIVEDSSDESRPGTPVLIDEKTGLPINNDKLSKSSSDNDRPKKSTSPNYSSPINEKINKLSKQLIDYWSTLPDVFKIPKKERIQMMKEHERQANEPQVKSEDDKDRWESRYSRHEKDKKRSIIPIVDVSRRSQIRTDDRVLSAIPAMSKEERRREFAARAAHQEQMRRAQSIGQPVPILTSNRSHPTNPWMPEYGPAVNGLPPSYNEYTPEYMQVDYTPTEYTQNSYGYYPPVYPVPPVNVSVPPPTAGYNYNQNYGPVPFPNHNPAPTMPNSSYLPLSSNLSRPPNTAIQPIPTVVAMQPSVVPSSQYDVPKCEDIGFYPTEPMDSSFQNRDNITPIPTPVKEKQEISNLNDVVRWSCVRLPPRWRSMKDARGRTYYYHIKIRLPQWTPPIYSPTLHSKDDDTSEEEQEVKQEEVENNEEESEIIQEKMIEGFNGLYPVIKDDKNKNGLIKGSKVVKKAKKQRPGLVTERIISPRHEDEIIASKLELKRYKERKEKMRRRKEIELLAGRDTEAINKYMKRIKQKKLKAGRLPEADTEVDEKTAKRIKETFRASMARVMVHHLDSYRRDDCTIGRITNTPDFKHLARKLTHFVMLKELKHCQSVNDLKCNDSVKQKAKEFVKKYMAKFGPIYVRPPDEVDCL